MNIPAFISERIVITVETSNERRKVFQLQFQKKDGSFFISFPYYKQSTGLLSRATIKKSQKQFSLSESGKVTNQRVKFTYHPDGRVHFSQDGKILTVIKNNSARLIQAEWHIFSIIIQGLNDFGELKPNEHEPLLSAKKTILNYRFEGNPPDAIKFIAHWYSESSLLTRVSHFGNKPWFFDEGPNSSRVGGAIISNPFIKGPGKYYLLLTYEGIPLIDKGNYSNLIFYGGFSSSQNEHTNDEKSFLALSYPASKTYEDLVQLLGTVDYVPKGI